VCAITKDVAVWVVLIMYAMGIIYKLTSPSGKVYIGQTTHPLKRRLLWHRSNAKKQKRKCTLIAQAILKYGMDAMKSETLMEVPDDLLGHYERRCIDMWDSCGENGYNVNPGYGGHVTKETKAKISQSLKETIAADPTAYERKSQAMREALNQPDSKKRARASRKEMWKDPAFRAKRQASQKAAGAHSAEVNARRSATVKATLARKRAAGLASPR